VFQDLKARKVLRRSNLVQKGANFVVVDAEKKGIGRGKTAAGSQLVGKGKKAGTTRAVLNLANQSVPRGSDGSTDEPLGGHLISIKVASGLVVSVTHPSGHSILLRKFYFILEMIESLFTRVPM